MYPLRSALSTAVIGSALLGLLAGRALAHCDTLDGPVVSAARKALESGNPTLVLIWVEKSKESELSAALRRTLAVRSLSPEAKELADTWFFETLVRIHRAGEGEAYTGLKRAGEVEPAIAAADRAVATGSLEPLAPYLPAGAKEAFVEDLKRVRSLAAFRPDDVDAGRAYVRAYVEFLHKLEHLHTEKAAPSTVAAELKSPKPLADEHAELHERLAEAMNAGGETAAAARALVKVLHPHFVREEQIATPPLSLLPALVHGGVTPEMRPALEMTRTLRRELPRMLEEHVAIKAALRALGEAAEREGKMMIARFSKRLARHAETEEAVLYPAALLVGDVLEAKLGK